MELIVVSGASGRLGGWVARRLGGSAVRLLVRDAAVAAGVRHLVYTSFAGAAPDATFTLARDHWATEAAAMPSDSGMATRKTTIDAGRSCRTILKTDMPEKYLLRVNQPLRCCVFQVSHSKLPPATQPAAARSWGC